MQGLGCSAVICSGYCLQISGAQSGILPYYRWLASICMDLGTFKGLSVYDSAELSTLHILFVRLNSELKQGPDILAGESE